MSQTARKLFTLDTEKGTIIELTMEQAREILKQNEREEVARKAYPAEEARKIVGLGRNKFMDLLHDGTIKGVKAGSKWIVPVWAIDDFLAAK
ncbi:hypothetical protein SPSIL_019990 [Sporomusa silvacetica DSM 10669]|uniref:Helix-turn-helix domain-containing protein n=1 Tax=Sporomusa silvacetica DSM 10669 TaxID=1123289 RepID=A0ABZ3IJJ5_9FIRM|nr:helix-turn-helix domain-containing protein [Sporomusa silvacetica]OZC18748.1 helix-turn-helix domain protein [Sporomusa silvacetica DSM 10669]